MRIPRATSAATLDALAHVQAAFAIGAATSAWRISWKAPMPSSQFGAWPESSTTGDSAIAAV